MRIRFAGALAVSSVSFCLGCESTGVGNPVRETTFELVTTDEPEPDGTDDDTGLPEGALEQALVALSYLEFTPCDPSEGTVRADGPFVLDLMSGRLEPELAPVDTPEAGFCSLAAPLYPVARPASLAGRSIFLSGTRSDGVRFLMYAAAEAELRLNARENSAWGAKDDEHFLWAFRPRRWLERRELEQSEINAESDGRGIVLIDSNRFPVLYQLILARISGTSDLYVDENRNSRLDLGELENGWVGVGLDSVE